MTEAQLLVALLSAIVALIGHAAWAWRKIRQLRFDCCELRNLVVTCDHESEELGKRVDRDLEDIWKELETLRVGGSTSQTKASIWNRDRIL